MGRKSPLVSPDRKDHALDALRYQMSALEMELLGTAKLRGAKESYWLCICRNSGEKSNTAQKRLPLHRI